MKDADFHALFCQFAHDGDDRIGATRALRNHHGFKICGGDVYAYLCLTDAFENDLLEMVRVDNKLNTLLGDAFEGCRFF